MTRATYPDIIKKLPKVKHSMEGVEGWLAQGENFQIAFFELQPTAKVPPHSHGSQYGVVMEGELALTIGEDTQVYGKGDTYTIPEGVTHHAVPKSVVLAMDFFDQADRYETE
ncbi:MAG: cupin domain-containing protein [Candidatus Thorarchaeota archaeon]|jgi:quercetin dioxygenase-like cupin family protein